MGIAVTAEGQQLAIILQISKTISKTPQTFRGLFGNINGYPNDDLISRSGVQVSPNDTEEVIFYNFGQTCEFLGDSEE